MPSAKSSKKYQITINHPKEKGWDHAKIKETLLSLKSIEYFCLADEVGEQGTYHTHIFLYARNCIRFQTLKNRMHDCHIEVCRGLVSDNKNYILKEGKWADTNKAETSVPGTFEEWGKLPDESGQGFRSDIAQLYGYISDGLSNAEIMALNPDLAIHISRMDKIRQDILEARYRDEWRDLEVTYIFGPTATGKTRGIMKKHGYFDTFRITDYKHPFDRYASELVLVFEEYRSSLLIGDMLNYLDGYPISLPARYANRVACYETVYIVSNIDLKQQYPGVQVDEPATWKAFLRRIHKVIEYMSDGSTIDHGNAMDYVFPPPKPIPAWVQEAIEADNDDEYDRLPL